MKTILCILMAIMLTSCGQEEARTKQSESRVTVVKPDPSNSSDARPSTGEFSTSNIEANDDGGLTIPNIAHPDWAGTNLIGNQRMNLIAVE